MADERRWGRFIIVTLALALVASAIYEPIVKSHLGWLASAAIFFFAMAGDMWWWEHRQQKARPALKGIFGIYLLLGITLGVAVPAVSVSQRSTVHAKRAVAAFTSRPTIKEVFEPGTGLMGQRGVISVASAIHGAVCRPSAFEPHREAYACVVPIGTLDPCLHDRLIQGLTCYVVPWPTGESDPIIEVIPRAFKSGSKSPLPREWEKPWGLELAGDVRCVRRDQLPNYPIETLYVCTHLNQKAGWITHKFPNESQPVWTVDYEPYGSLTGTAVIEPVVRAWE
jgi:hypothetical protein